MERYLHARSGRCLVGLRDGRRAMTNGYQAGRSGDDALEFPDGTYVLLTDLREGQEATVFQLPAQPKRQPRRRPRRASSTLADIRWTTRLIGMGGQTRGSSGGIRGAKSPKRFLATIIIGSGRCRTEISRSRQ